jgi:hypothetical protein
MLPRREQGRRRSRSFDRGLSTLTSALPLSYPARKPERGSNPRPLVPKEPLPAHRLDAYQGQRAREQAEEGVPESNGTPFGASPKEVTHPITPHSRILVIFSCPTWSSEDPSEQGGQACACRDFRSRSHRWPPEGTEVPRAFTPSDHSGLPITGMHRGQEGDDTTPCQAPLETLISALQGRLTGRRRTLPGPRPIRAVAWLLPVTERGQR